MNVFSGKPDPQDLTVASIRLHRDRGDSRVMRVAYKDASEAEGCEATVIVARSIGATPEAAAQAVADRVNLHYPPDVRLAVVRERDKLGGEYRIVGNVDAGLLAEETRLNVPA